MSKTKIGKDSLTKKLENQKMMGEYFASGMSFLDFINLQKELTNKKLEQANADLNVAQNSLKQEQDNHDTTKASLEQTNSLVTLLLDAYDKDHPVRPFASNYEYIVKNETGKINPKDLDSLKEVCITNVIAENGLCRDFWDNHIDTESEVYAFKSQYCTVELQSFVDLSLVGCQALVS